MPQWFMISPMKDIPLKPRATLVEQFNVKVDRELKQDLRVLEAHGVDFPELVRSFLRKEVPRIKKKLQTA